MLVGEVCMGFSRRGVFCPALPLHLFTPRPNRDHDRIFRVGDSRKCRKGSWAKPTGRDTPGPMSRITPAEAMVATLPRRCSSSSSSKNSADRCRRHTSTAATFSAFITYAVRTE